MTHHHHSDYGPMYVTSRSVRVETGAQKNSFGCNLSISVFINT